MTASAHRGRPETGVGALRALLSGELLSPEHSAWEATRTARKLSVDQRPAAVAVPADASDAGGDVIATGACARPIWSPRAPDKTAD